MLVWLTSACVNHQAPRSWGEGQWPSWQKFGDAAKTAATSRQTWMPLLAAGLLQIDEADERWSEDLADSQSLFGSDASDVSDTLRDVSTGAYVVTALLAESDSYGDKIRGFGVGVGTMVLDGVISQGIKDAVGRERPNGANDQSFPSGHASKAASRTNMAIRNLEHVALADWQKQSLTWLLHGVAAGTGLARVEAERHHLSDVLVGYALGHFISTFMYEAFMQDSAEGLTLSFQGIENGGALTLTIPLR